MTLDFRVQPSPYLDPQGSEDSATNHAELPHSFYKVKEMYDAGNEKNARKDETGIDADWSDSISGRYGSIEENPIITMVDDAFEQLNDAEFDQAVDTINAAMEHALSCRDNVRELIDYAINRLSTLGGPADPPHPGALNLVRKRMDLAL